MLAEGENKSSATSGVVKTLSAAKLQLCGTPAYMMTRKVNAGHASAILQQEIAVKSGYAYILLYTRPAATGANTQISAMMRAFCPSGSETIPAMKLPAGWTKSSTELEVVGAWMGTRPGQIITLMRGSQMSSLDKLLSTARLRSGNGGSGKSLFKITSQRTVSMCGYPGMTVDMSVNATQVPTDMHFALTQGNGASYVLMYMQMGTAPTDPAAMASLRTLCVTRTSPAATASPMPTPSPTPTPTPTPTPSTTSSAVPGASPAPSASPASSASPSPSSSPTTVPSSNRHKLHGNRR